MVFLFIYWGQTFSIVRIRTCWKFFQFSLKFQVVCTEDSENEQIWITPLFCLWQLYCCRVHFPAILCGMEKGGKKRRVYLEKFGFVQIVHCRRIFMVSSFCMLVVFCRMLFVKFKCPFRPSVPHNPWKYFVMPGLSYFLILSWLSRIRKLFI